MFERQLSECRHDSSLPARRLSGLPSADLDVPAGGQVSTASLEAICGRQRISDAGGEETVHLVDGVTRRASRTATR